MNRKGTLWDGFSIMLIILVFMVMTVVAVYFISTVNDAFAGSNSIPQSAKDITSGYNSQVPWVFDFLGLMLMVSLPVVSLILAFFNNIHPLFFWASFGLSLILVIVASSLGDMWESITSDTLSATAASMPMTDWILSHFGLYAMFVIALVGFGVFVKSKNPEGYL